MVYCGITFLQFAFVLKVIWVWDFRNQAMNAVEHYLIFFPITNFDFQFYALADYWKTLPVVFVSSLPMIVVKVRIDSVALLTAWAHFFKALGFNWTFCNLNTVK